MRLFTSSLGALVILTGLGTSSAPAQQFGVAGVGGNAFGAAGFGNGGNAGFNNFGGGGFNSFGGNNFGGFNNGYGYNRGYANYNAYPQTYNNMGGLMNSIRTQTGRGNSYRSGYGPAVGGRRR